MAIVETGDGRRHPFLLFPPNLLEVLLGDFTGDSELGVAWGMGLESVKEQASVPSGMV